MIRKTLCLSLLLTGMTSVSHADSKVGELFLVDHFNSAGGRGAHQGYKNWIKNKSLGGIIFWNSNNDSFQKFQTMTNDYKAAARTVGKDSPILSIDHEGQGVQRLRSRQGFTNLTTPSNLGRAVQKQNSYEVCELHGEIMAKELALSGLNSSLGTIADTYNSKSGTRGMLRSRAISADPKLVANCLRSIMDGVRSSNEDFLFVTKHFPGLGSVNGNTDLGLKTSKARSQNEANTNIFPFKDVIKYTEKNYRGRLGMMSSNAAYPLYDGNTPAPESKKILTDLLRKKLKFRGVLVSDALWLGQYEGYSRTRFKIALSTMVLAGMDMLMIPASKFEANYAFFANFYNGSVPADISNSLIKSHGFRSENDLIRTFQKRIDESVNRIRKTKSKLSTSTVQEGLSPKNQTQSLRASYQRLLQ